MNDIIELCPVEACGAYLPPKRPTPDGDTPLDTLDPKALAWVRHEKQTERTVTNEGWGSTKGALAIVDNYLDDLANDIKGKLEVTKVSKGPLGLLGNLEPELLAVVILQSVISSVASSEYLMRTVMTVGRACEHELYRWGLENHDAKLLDRLTRGVKKRHSSMKYRKQALRSAAQKAGYNPKRWTDKDRATVGMWLLDVGLESPALVLAKDDQGEYVTLTEEALAISDALVSRMIHERAVFLPMLQEPDDWQDVKTVLHYPTGSYEATILRGRNKEGLARLSAAIRDGKALGVLQAINGAQRVSYRINEPILEMVEWCYREGVRVKGLPPIGDVPPPVQEKPWDAMSEGERKVWKKRVVDTKVVNKGYLGERLRLTQDLEIAKWIVEHGNKFWTPLNMDYRGRVYGLPYFNFQRQDYVRAMFLFDEGKPVGTGEGLYWLAVHVANCGDFGKISKKPFDQRVKWVQDNRHAIFEIAEDPKANVWWMDADKPFLFLAACMEFTKAYWDRTYECRVPVSFDGSCSGLQHLCAMTRAEEGALVNLTPSEQPQDIYQVVADKAKAKVERDLEHEELASMAKIALDNGVNRSLVKRNVMTYSYSSKKFGMAQQHMEDTMRPLEYKVLAGDLDEHPYGEDNGYAASRYLAGVIFETIEEVVSRPAEAMRFLQDIARALAHEGLPTVWHTPLGLPVVLKYPKYEARQITLWMHDKGVKRRFRPKLQEETKDIDKARSANAIAPGFVHSLDACHLMMVVRGAIYQAGITNIALVHDSFGCLPADAGLFRMVISDAFWELYKGYDVLADIREEALAQIHTNGYRIPPVPTYGTLDINEVRNAQYAFA